MLCLTTITTAFAHHAPIKVAYINPEPTGNVFWDSVTKSMQAAADDLSISLTVFNAKNRYDSTEIAQRLLASKDKPDYLLFIYQRNQGYKILQYAEQAEVKSFIFNTDIPLSERKKVGDPMEKFRYWIGHLHENHMQAGYKKAASLISLGYEHLGQSALLQMAAITGSRDSNVAIASNMGLDQALTEHPEVVLPQISFSQWDTQIASQQAEGLLKRYSNTRLFWVLGENASLAVIDTLERLGVQVGQDVFVAGSVWSQKGINAVQQGKMLANVGGSTWEGASALVRLHDYHHRQDLSLVGDIPPYNMEIVSKRSIDKYIDMLTNRYLEHINFCALSLVLNPQLLEYDFSVEALIEAQSKSNQCVIPAG